MPMNKAAEIRKKYDLEVNTNKTKVMVISKEKNERVTSCHYPESSSTSISIHNP